MNQAEIEHQLKKRETNFVSLKLFIIYFCLVMLDILTTLMTDENLKHEGNIITTFFVNNKFEFIIYVLVIASISVFLTHLSSKYLIFMKPEDNLIGVKKFLASITVIFFYTHLVSLLWVIPNNILHNIGINGNDNWLFFDLSKSYVHLCNKYYPYYQIVMQVLLFVLAYIIFKRVSLLINKSN